MQGSLRHVAEKEASCSKRRRLGVGVMVFEVALSQPPDGSICDSRVKELCGRSLEQMTLHLRPFAIPPSSFPSRANAESL